MERAGRPGGDPMTSRPPSPRRVLPAHRIWDARQYRPDGAGHANRRGTRAARISAQSGSLPHVSWAARMRAGRGFGSSYGSRPSLSWRNSAQRTWDRLVVFQWAAAKKPRGLAHDSRSSVEGDKLPGLGLPRIPSLRAESQGIGEVLRSRGVKSAVPLHYERFKVQSQYRHGSRVVRKVEGPVFDQNGIFKREPAGGIKWQKGWRRRLGVTYGYRLWGRL